MASSMLKLISKTFVSTSKKHCPLFIVVRHTSKRPYKKPKIGTIRHRNLIESSCASLGARGFLRSYKPYSPAENVREKILGFCNEILGSGFDHNTPLSTENKFVLLTKCFEEINHSVPNSLLHKIENVTDVIEFYETPVSTTTPLDEFKNKELPPNLHIQYEYLRFDPETDTMFKGISAFPRSSTIVTGLKYKEKYKGFKAKSPYLDTEPVYKDHFS